MLFALNVRLLSLQIFLVTSAWCAFTLNNLPTPLEAPGKMKLKYLTRGYGTQNYVCQGGKWTPSGAEARLVYQVTDKSSHKKVTKSARIIGHHSFTVGKNRPTFSISGVGTVTCEKKNAAPAPNHQDVAWLELNVVTGSIAKRVYRTHTVKGLPSNPTCKATDQPLKVQYSAIYSFWV